MSSLALSPAQLPSSDHFNGSGQKLYEQAKKRIPGGTQLLSKRPEMYLPDGWPAYYSRASGCTVWDLDDRKYLDFTSNGIGSCLLGYSDPDVNQAVGICLEQGTQCTLNAPEEVELADLLCEIHPWADSVRYTRCGGEAMSVAVRIARASNGRSKIAFCGYHGWGDWYLAANLAGDTALDGHLIPGLSPNGVPRELLGTAMPFHYNKIDELESIVGNNRGELAAIVMEPMRSEPPHDGFLEKVRKLASDCGAVLIVDEITSGWRSCWGGLHLQLGLEPDIAVYAKAISNGFPMAAIVGKSDVMDAAQTSFISSTYWTERIGPVAALATLRKLRATKAWEGVRHAGQKIQEGWKARAAKCRLKVKVTGQPALSYLSFDCGLESRAAMTLFTQEMLDKGFLASGSFYPTCAHHDVAIDSYLAATDESFQKIALAVREGTLSSQLKGPVAHSGFSRLT